MVPVMKTHRSCPSLVCLFAWLLAACIQPGKLPATLCAPSDTIHCYPSPDQQWVAEVNVASGRLNLKATAGTVKRLFAADSAIREVAWSPDSQHLLIVQTNASQPTQLWQVALTNRQMSEPRVVFISIDKERPEGIVFGDWSPNNRYLLFWVDPWMSASFLADGTPLRLLDSQTGKAQLITNDGPLGRATGALLNPRYHSWAPDSSLLAITLGGYRSAQINKWLVLYNPMRNVATVVVSDTEQIPGIVAWSPNGDQIAYAAVPTAETSEQNADWTSFDNPAIANRRIYLLDSRTGKHERLNNADIFQDAPIWKADGSQLYYVQRNGDQAVVLAAALAMKQFKSLSAVGQPLSAITFYYGQFEWANLLRAVEK